MWPPYEFATRVVNIHKNDYDVLIMRPSIFGNPFRLGPKDSRHEVLKKYRVWLAEKVKTDEVFKTQLLALKGKRLGCCCSPMACHGHVIAEMVEDPSRFIP
jgi:hypothetical protein